MVQVVGNFAQLLSIANEELARVLSLHLRSLLCVVVVSTNDCRHRLGQQLQASQRPVPDFLSLTHTQPFKPPGRGEVGLTP